MKNKAIVTESANLAQTSVISSPPKNDLYISSSPSHFFSPRVLIIYTLFSGNLSLAPPRPHLFLAEPSLRERGLRGEGALREARHQRGGRGEEGGGRVAVSAGGVGGKRRKCCNVSTSICFLQDTFVAAQEGGGSSSDVLCGNNNGEHSMNPSEFSHIFEGF